MTLSEQKPKPQIRGVWPDYIISPSQFNLLEGHMLGDGCMILYGNSKNPHLVIDRSIKDIDYIRYSNDIFQDITSAKISYYDNSKKFIQNGKIYKLCRFHTRSCPYLLKDYYRWYPNGKKIVPKDLQLTPLIVAIWFCDDGFARLRGKNKNRIHMRFCSEGFTKEENEFLAKLLTDFCGETVITNPISKGSEKYRITATDMAARAIARKIDQYIPISMNRKAVWKGKIDLHDSNYEGGKPTYKNRNKLSNKETILINILKRGEKSIKELILLLNSEFKISGYKTMTEQYIPKFIERLYRRKIINRRIFYPHIENNNGGRQYVYLYF